MSTHFGYAYPPEFEKHLPVDNQDKWGYFFGKPDLEKPYNRYKNALLFTDDIICNLIESIDLEKNIVVVTGDHGESFMEDGFYTHASNLSDYQTRVPMVIFGPDIEPGTINDFTEHIDLLPSLLHLASGEPIEVKHSQGRDLFSNQKPTNRTLLSNGQMPLTDVSFASGSQRLRAKINWIDDEFRITRFETALGEKTDSTKLTLQEIETWQQLVESEFIRLNQ